MRYMSVGKDFSMVGIRYDGEEKLMVAFVCAKPVICLHALFHNTAHIQCVHTRDITQIILFETAFIIMKQF